MHSFLYRLIIVIPVFLSLFSCSSFDYSKDTPGESSDYSYFIDTGKYTVHYYDLGPIFHSGKMQKPIVMIHGWMGSAYDYRPIVHILARRRRVLVPDLPGSGYTKANPEKDKSKHYNLESFVDFVLDFTNSLNLENFVLIGHSMGGEIAINFTNKYPSKVSCLVLIAPDGLKNEEGDWLFFSKWGFLVDIFSALNTRTFIKIGLKLNVFYDPNVLTDEFVDAVSLTALSGNRRKVQAEITKNIIGHGNVDELLKYLNVPTLLLWGKNDKVLKVKWASVFNSGIKDSSLIIIDKCGHMPMYEKPVETASYIERFLLEKKCVGN